jgi:hypothetical protein
LRSIRAGGRRRENFDRLARDGRMDLFWSLLYTLLIMDDRGISQREVAARAGKDRQWVRITLSADPSLSYAAMERNLMAIDHVVTEITEGEGK